MKKFVLVSIWTLTTIVALSQPKSAQQTWKDQKYSMFIHWGAIYSSLGGVWNGKPVTTGYSEQIQAHAGIYSDVYANVAKRFNPQRWKPDSIALLAKAAGMKSVVITSKHHDGFCMFKSAYTTYNVVDATPYKRDVVKELADACKKHNLRFGVYFSLIDWHFPQAYPISSHNSDPITEQHHHYNVEQVTELLTNYGPISEIWFDMGSLTAAQSQELATLVHRLQPDCMVSGRLGNDAGDFCVMGDNDYPNYKIATPWQTPASVYDETWGYRSWQEHGPVADKAMQKLEGLLKVVSRGGNYLLNIGPRGDGSVVDFEKDVLLRNGKWLAQNGEAVYGAAPSPFGRFFDWGEVTAKENKLYLSLLRQPEGNIIALPGLKGEIASVTVLDSSRARLNCRIFTEGNTTYLELPSKFKLNNRARVLRLNFSAPYAVLPENILEMTPNSHLVLDRHNAEKHYSFSGIDYNSYYRSTVANSWRLKASTDMKVIPWLSYTQQERDNSITLTVNDRSQVVKLVCTDSLLISLATRKISWSPMYLAGPYWNGISWANGDVNTIDVTKPWPAGHDARWKKTDWKNDKVYELEADWNNSWYVYQEVKAEEAGQYIIRLTSGDGIQVFLNGEEQVVHNNPARGFTQQEYLVLPLQAGVNKLVVKVYNRFAKKTVVSIDKDVPQLMYRQRLAPLQLKKDEVGAYSWQLYNPVSVHRDMRMPNLELHLAQ
ncbi:alpha-L-fucosidase [Chitinophaga horti]|uniref:alpha-L-fucosidase n=1 Tax=Chitinophaga horti TaxID=2920382 RepID=A0ABY6J5F0_9BACT|nr:alpha-L-fucosidase [Chitinophaga horti]UYQ94909.1 alpha-L-fucosidase [Chitinophaga horti]